MKKHLGRMGVGWGGGVNSYYKRDQKMDNTFKRDGKPERLRTPALEDYYYIIISNFEHDMFSLKKGTV